MKKIERTVMVKKRTFLVFIGLLTGKQIEEENPSAHLRSPDFLEGLFLCWTYEIEVKYRTHSEKELRRFLRRLSTQDWFRGAKQFKYYYIDSYETSFKDGKQTVELESKHGYNESEEREIKFDKP